MRQDFRVYLIDDDPSARGGLSRLLRMAGHDVESFQSGGEFLKAIPEDAKGCIILDARMPGLSGEELCKELRKRGLALPLIFVTADDNPEIKALAVEVQAAGFFRKPVDGTALLDAIDWAMRKD